MKITLRKYREDDFEAMFALVSDYDVVKMTSSWPYPAEPAFTRMRMNTPECKSGQVSAIEVDGIYAGGIGLVQGEIGYFIARDFWGQGVMSRAIILKLSKGFADPLCQQIAASVWADNPASARVLEKAGFEQTGQDRYDCKARGTKVDGVDFTLSRAKWLKIRSESPN